MRNGLRRFIALFLAVVIFYNLSCHLVYFIFKQQVIRHAVHELLQHHEAPLSLLVLSEKEVTELLSGEDSEFYYHNELYDVAAIEKSGSNVKLFCYKDVAEKNLLHQLVIHSRTRDAAGHKGKNLKLNYFSFTDVIFLEKEKLFYETNVTVNFADAFLISGQFIPGSNAHPPECC